MSAKYPKCTVMTARIKEVSNLTENAMTKGVLSERGQRFPLQLAADSEAHHIVHLKRRLNNSMFNLCQQTEDVRIRCRARREVNGGTWDPNKSRFSITKHISK